MLSAAHSHFAKRFYSGGAIDALLRLLIGPVRETAVRPRRQTQGEHQGRSAKGEVPGGAMRVGRCSRGSHHHTSCKHECSFAQPLPWPPESSQITHQGPSQASQ